MDRTISDELLAAYLDGNTSPTENQMIEPFLKNDMNFAEISDIISDMPIIMNPSFSAVIDDIFLPTNALSEQQITDNIMDYNGEPSDIQQQYSDTCAIKSQQIILNEFGIDVNEDQLVQFSYENGWYSGDGSGTLPQDVGNLLESANIPVTRQTDANVFNLVSELSQGHKVIVGVDSGELWHNKFWGWLNDFFMGDTPDHALIVAGIDTSDPDNVMVIVDDPGTGEYHKAYPLDQFMDAWSDAQCYMVSTDIPVPSYAATMVNFDYSQGHLADVGGMDYADFQIFNDLSYGLPPVSIVDGMQVSPTSALMDAYFDVANNELAFNDIFSSDYMFNDYLDTDIATQMMQQTYQDNVGFINFNDMPNVADYQGLSSNQEYETFLHESIDYFSNVGDFNSAMLCEQQLMMVDYCDSNDIDFCSTFLCS